MKLFGRKKEEGKNEEGLQLPSLPQLPEFPRPEEEQMEIHGLPSFPSNYSGTQFSQSMIKEAVSGEKEDDYEEEGADDLASAYDMRMMQQPPARRPMPMREEQPPQRRYSQVPANMSQEPLFVRIDKFEAAHNILDDTRKKISEIESAIEEIKAVKDREERELQAWENTVKLMKEQIEKIDRDLFSKV